MCECVAWHRLSPSEAGRSGRAGMSPWGRSHVTGHALCPRITQVCKPWLGISGDLGTHLKEKKCHFLQCGRGFPRRRVRWEVLLGLPTLWLNKRCVFTVLKRCFPGQNFLFHVILQTARPHLGVFTVLPFLTCAGELCRGSRVLKCDIPFKE